jgi:hypothetical protein
MSPDDRLEFIRILQAHARTVDVCQVCAETARDLAAEVKRGGLPPREHLTQTITAAEQVLNDLRGVRAELQRLQASLGVQP